MDAASPKIHPRPSRQEPQNVVVRELSAFLWAVMEIAGSRSLRDAAKALFPRQRIEPTLRDRLQHMLLVAAATLCNSASEFPAATAATPTAARRLPVGDIVQSAHRSIAAVQHASAKELAEAHAYFLASPPWWDELATPRTELADLSFGVARFMIECALDVLPDLASASASASALTDRSA
jgi:hypothetical protein